jgi:transcriptional antiterminator NusG
MDWYVLRTLCGKEEVVLSIFNKMEIFSEFDVFCPKRRISWRKGGHILSIIRPLFEGYLFVSVPCKKIGKFDRLLRMYRLNVARLVRSAGSLAPISSEEKLLLQGLMDYERVVEVSKIEIVKEQLKVIDGPLLGCEHMIKNFSSRKHRITIEVPLLHERKKIELEGILINPEREGRERIQSGKIIISGG